MRLNLPQRLIVALNPAHHKSAFERGHDQCRHRLRIHSGMRVALFLSLRHEGLHAAHPGSKSFCDARPKDGVAVVGPIGIKSCRMTRRLGKMPNRLRVEWTWDMPHSLTSMERSE